MMDRSLFLTLAHLLSGTAVDLAQAQSKPTNGTPTIRTNVLRPAATRFPKPNVKYPPAPEGIRKDGVPRGTVTDFEWRDGKAFPGTLRRWLISEPVRKIN